MNPNKNWTSNEAQSLISFSIVTKFMITKTPLQLGHKCNVLVHFQFPVIVVPVVKSATPYSWTSHCKVPLYGHPCTKYSSYLLFNKPLFLSMSLLTLFGYPCKKMHYLNGFQYLKRLATWTLGRAYIYASAYCLKWDVSVANHCLV